MVTTQTNNTTTLDVVLFTERKRLVRLCAQLTGDATLAEDLAQETLLVAWRNGHQLHPELQAEAAAWGLGIAPTEQWQKTRLYCPSCGQHYLHGRFSQNGQQILQLYCPCGLNSCTRYVDGLFDGIHGYRAALTCTAQWRHGYLQTGLQAGHLTCLGCGRPVLLHSKGAPDLTADFAEPALSATPGRWAQCHHCGWRQQVDLEALAGVVPAAQTFWRQHKRVCTLPLCQVDYAGAAALVVGIQSINSCHQLDLLFDRQSLSLLALQQT